VKKLAKCKKRKTRALEINGLRDRFLAIFDFFTASEALQRMTDRQIVANGLAF
jgi:hypothetical protein